MTILEGLRSHLLADASIAAIVTAQIYPGMLPQKVLARPDDTTGAIVFQRVSSIRWAHLRGSGALARPRVQLDSWARTYTLATRLGALVRQRLEGFRGDWTDGGSPATLAHVTVFFDTEQDLVEPEINGGLYRHSADYFLFHSTAQGVL